MPNPGQPTIKRGATGDTVRRAQRALRRAPDLGPVVDGVFGSATEAAVTEFQQGSTITADGVVGPLTWRALPDGGAMPALDDGSTGAAVTSLQRILTNGAPGSWFTTPQGVDGAFGPNTTESVRAFQKWAGVNVDGVVGEQTWDVSMMAASATLESLVGLNFVID
jgi:peptidoglycan hydrolase-like protein with peptidoglycan-binding domain